MLTTQIPGTTNASYREKMQATFFQKVIICAVAGFAAACLLKWGMVFVEGADDALNGGYPKARTTEVIPASR